MAPRHRQPRDPALLGRLNQELPPDNSRFYRAEAARWYSVEYSWRTEDVDFYRHCATEYAGPGGSVLELACGEGRVTVPMAEAGFRVTAVDVAPEMLDSLLERVAADPDPMVPERVEVVHADMRKLHLDRLYRMVYLPFNTLLILSQPHERFQALERVREHLAPSGAFCFDIFTPDPRLLLDEPEWRDELDHVTEDPVSGRRVHVLREVRSRHDYGRQVKHLDFRHTITADEGERELLASWEDALDIAYIFPRELELLLERQGFRIKARYGGPDRRPYAPRPEQMQPQYVVAEVAP